MHGQLSRKVIAHEVEGVIAKGHVRATSELWSKFVKGGAIYRGIHLGTTLGVI